MAIRCAKEILRGMVCDISEPKLHAAYDTFVSVSNYHVVIFSSCRNHNGACMLRAHAPHLALARLS
jgi:predicted molibdopterin-dependent oxidoreductase YjgC